MPIHLRLVIFALVFGLLSWATHLFLYRRLVRDVWADPKIRRRGVILFTALGVFLCLGVPIARFIASPYSWGLSMLVFGYMGVLALLLFIIIRSIVFYYRMKFPIRPKFL